MNKNEEWVETELMSVERKTSFSNMWIETVISTIVKSGYGYNSDQKHSNASQKERRKSLLLSFRSDKGQLTDDDEVDDTGNGTLVILISIPLLLEDSGNIRRCLKRQEKLAVLG